MIIGNTTGESHAYMVTLPCIVFFAITPLFLVIRVWNRLLGKSGLGVDDWTILASFACTLVVQIAMMISVHYGFGKHIYSLSDHDRKLALEYFYIAQIFYKLTINLTKTSILLLYLRIFPRRWFRICCYILMGFILAYMVATTAAAIWQCHPIRGAWDKSMHPSCISLTKNWYANAGYSIATDVLILMLPMQPIWTSKLPVSQKRALIFVFLLGSFVTVTSILRATTLSFSTKTPDVTYDIASTLWTMIEENVAIICACLPMCRMLLGWAFPAVFGSSAVRAGQSGPSNGHERSPSELSNGRWKPYMGPPKIGGVNNSIVHHGNETSEEYILNPRRPPGVAYDEERAIRKTTEYHISYENEPYAGPYAGGRATQVRM